MIWNRNIRDRIARRASARSAALPSMFEELEQRMVLYQTPMVSGFVPLNAPTPLESRSDSIVRILTNVGAIDIELFEGLAPTVTANFRSYIANGGYDESFFHSLANGQLAGGSYKFDDVTGLSNIAAGAPIPNGFSRSNLAQTLSMVPISSTQLTSRFIINLQDNVGLDTQNGGFTVFAKVIQGWSIVQTIAGFTARDLNVPLTGSASGPFGAVPTTPAFNPVVGPREATLVKIVDIETIKAPGLPSYYGTQLVYPEGSRSATTTETISLVNQDLTNINYFQVIVHYETGDRDAVIYTGSLAGGARFSLKVNDSTLPGLNLVRQNSKYSFDVRSTRHMAASLNHVDSGSQLGESFYITPQIPVGQFKGYQFGNGVKGAGDTTIIVVENLDGASSIINVQIFPESGSTQYFQIVMEGFRRGSLNFANFASIPDGNFSVWATSTAPFVAAVTHTRTGAATDGSTAQGIQGNGRVKGALAGAYLATGGSAFVDFMYTGASSFVIVDVTITLSGAGGTLTPSPITLSQVQQRRTLDLSTVPGLPRDAYFTIQYSERTQTNAVAASYRSEIGGDEVSTPFQVASTTNVLFADGFTDPAQVGSGAQSQTLSIFNPYTATSASISFTYQLLFHFSDGTQLWAPEAGPLGLAPLARRDHQASAYSNVFNKISSDPQFYHYSIEIVVAVFGFPVPIGGVVAQLTRIENGLGQSVTSLPSYDPAFNQFHGVVYLDNPEFGT